MSGEFILAEACSKLHTGHTLCWDDTQHMTFKLINIEIYMCVYVMCVHYRPGVAPTRITNAWIVFQLLLWEGDGPKVKFICDIFTKV